MGAQVGCLSAFQLGIHDHLSDERGGILNAYSRYGAYRRPYRTGALVLSCDNDTERQTFSLIPVLLKETRINVAQPGRYRVRWEMKNDLGVINVSSRFYVNGAIVGALNTNGTDVWTEYFHNYDVDLAAGDLLQVWGFTANIGDRCWVRDFHIHFDWGLPGFGDGTLNNLVTGLPLSDAGLLDFTAVT